eukprot:9697098-Ditylum_brightwellii.AAC.1
MDFVTMTPPSATLLNLGRNTFSQRTVSQNSRGSGRHAKRRGLTGHKVKDLNAFVKDKIDKTIKERNHNMHAMSNFEDLSISSSNDSIESIISNTSNEESDSESCKTAYKK